MKKLVKLMFVVLTVITNVSTCISSDNKNDASPDGVINTSCNEQNLSYQELTELLFNGIQQTLESESIFLEKTGCNNFIDFTKMYIEDPSILIKQCSLGDINDCSKVLRDNMQNSLRQSIHYLSIDWLINSFITSDTKDDVTLQPMLNSKVESETINIIKALNECGLAVSQENQTSISNSINEICNKYLDYNAYGMTIFKNLINIIKICNDYNEKHTKELLEALETLKNMHPENKDKLKNYLLQNNEYKESLRYIFKTTKYGPIIENISAKTFDYINQELNNNTITLQSNNDFESIKQLWNKFNNITNQLHNTSMQYSKAIQKICDALGIKEIELN
ncbi:MAG: hypothetical protein IJU54_02870 [Alphaproteobacteria bacterium]|nr:hypothetical protein [Alphaproteobacteria bacterium]